MKQYYKGYGYRDNPTYPPYDCMTLTRCEKCGELYEADKEHVCLRKNSYPWDMMTDAGEDMENTDENPFTNFDRLRAMTDEELAKWFIDKGRYFGEEYEGYMSLLEWLREEVSEK